MIDWTKYRGLLPNGTPPREKSGPRNPFQEQFKAARPDLSVFHARPWWQRALIRLVWRVAPDWLPRRERDAIAFRNARGKIPPDIDLEI